MSVRTRKVLWWIVVVFALYAVWKSPEQAAGVVRNLGDWLGTALSSIASFFDGLLQG